MKTQPLKIISLILLLATAGKMNAQDDQPSVDTLDIIYTRDGMVATSLTEDKINVNEFMAHPLGNCSEIGIKYDIPDSIKVKIFTMNGDLEEEQTLSLGSGVTEFTLDKDDLADGSYMVEFYTKEGSAVRRMIKMN